MKRIILILLSAATVFSLSSCGGKNDLDTRRMEGETTNPGHYEAPTPIFGDKQTETPTANDAMPTPTPTPTPAPIGPTPEMGQPTPFVSPFETTGTVPGGAQDGVLPGMP